MKILQKKECLGLCLLIGMLFSCDKKDTTIPHVEMSVADVVFTVDGGTSEVTINSNTTWELKSYQCFDHRVEF